ncbi:hypothetical protein DL98DRAFT_653334 [Cadophora sp. DSE1049]|nr:hypothetical protein DL98DRAFT_653334 [Cadophora sp. DSE1049]
MDGFGSPDPGTFYASGLRCKPIITSKAMTLTVNISSENDGQSILNRIESSDSKDASQEQSLGKFLPSLLPFMNPTTVKALFLRNGTEFLRTEIFTKFHLNAPYLDDNGEVVGFSYITVPPWDTFIDPWFYILTEGNLTRLNNYREHLDELEADSKTLFTTIWIHLLDLYARQDQAEPLDGAITTQEPRLMVSETSVWALVAIFGIFLGIIICLATVFKPITHLSEDPGNLAAIAVVLARNPRLRELFKGRDEDAKMWGSPTDDLGGQHSSLVFTAIPSSTKRTSQGTANASVQSWKPFRLTVPYLALVRARDVALFASALSILIYPAVKIAAAGLFVPATYQNQTFMQVEVDNSFSAMLNVSEPVDFVEAALYANAYTLTALEQLYNVSSSPNFIGSGISSSLVIENLTGSSVNDAIYQLVKNGGETVATLPALKIVISCNSTSGLEEVEFSDGTLDSTSCYQNSYDISYASGGETFMLDGGEYTSIAISNCEGKNATALSGVWCQKTCQEVDVNVTLRQRTVDNLGQKSTTALEISDIDMSSVLVTNPSLPGGDWIYPVLFPEAVVRTDGGYGVNRSIGFDNMTAYSGPGWNVTAAMSTNSPTFVNILLTGLVSRGQDIEDLFEPTTLQAHMEKLYLRFHIHAIDQMRTLASVGPNPVMKPVLVLTEDLRLKQSHTSTIIVCALLGVILLLTFLAFVTVQSKGIVNMPPTTLAAQFAILSDSSLVDELETSGATSTSDTNIWYDDRFAMGWISPGCQGAANAGKNPRLWGVDFDERIHRRE